MNKFITTIKNIFAIEDLRTRILNTLFFIAIYRLGSYVVLPGVDPTRLKTGAAGLFGILDTLLGGAFRMPNNPSAPVFRRVGSTPGSTT